MQLGEHEGVLIALGLMAFSAGPGLGRPGPFLVMADLAGADLLHSGVLLVIPGDVAEARLDHLVGLELGSDEGSGETHRDQDQNSCEKQPDIDSSIMCGHDLPRRRLWS